LRDLIIDLPIKDIRVVTKPFCEFSNNDPREFSVFGIGPVILQTIAVLGAVAIFVNT
jgi:hypothetical protein